MLTDKDHINSLLKRIVLSEQKAFEELFHLCFPRLITKIISIVGKKEVAEEIVEDVFIKLWQKREALAEIENIVTYLYVAAKNRSYNYLSSSSYNRPLQLIDETEVLADDLSPEDIYLSRELKRELDYAIAALPERCRHIFELVRIKGHSYKETAEILNVTPKTVENQLAIAMKKLSQYLERYYKDSPAHKGTGNKALAVSFLLAISGI